MAEPALRQPLRRLGLVLNPRRDTSPVVAEVQAWARRHGADLFLLAAQDGSGTSDLPRLDPERAGSLQLILAVGGDGTMLQALRLAVDTDVAVLGVAFGHLGYLTEDIAERCAEVLDELDAGRHIRRPLLALQARVLDADRDAAALAVNDIVLSRTPGEGQAFLSVEVNGDRFVRYSTDALVLAAPLGSTAYSLSAGGPLASPDMDLLLLTPVAPQGVFDRTLLIPTTDVLVVEVLEGSAPVVVEADGAKAAVLHAGQRLQVEVATQSTAIVRLDGTSFYSRVRTRLLIPDAPVLSSRQEG